MEFQPKTPTTKGPAEWFTGDVHFDVIARGEAPSRLRVNVVRFAPGARTAWHAHSLGQTLHVTGEQLGGSLGRRGLGSELHALDARPGCSREGGPAGTRFGGARERQRSTSCVRIAASVTSASVAAAASLAAQLASSFSRSSVGDPGCDV